MSELMRRAAPGLALAGAALATVWVFDPALQAQVADTAQASAADSATGEDPGAGADSPADTGTDPAPSTGTEDLGESDATGTEDLGESDDTGSEDTGSAAAEPAPATEDPTPAAGSCSDPTSVTGDPAMTRWGPVQVQMDFAADGTVCGVQAIAYPDNDHRSAQINSMAIPYLDSQAAEVGVEFDSVSGATYTSEAYRESMQSILDQR